MLGETANSFMPTGKYFLKEYDATHVDIYPVDRNVYVAYWAQRDVTTIKKNEAGDFYATKAELIAAVSDFFADAPTGGGGSLTDADTLDGHHASYFQTALGYTPEQAGVADGLVTALKGGVTADGDNLKKLNDKTDGKANRERVTFSKATINVAATASFVAQTGVFTPGTDAPGATLVNIPDASTVPAGQRLVIADESGSIRPWFRLQVTPNGTQTIDGANTYANLVYPYSMITLISNGLNGWNIENVKPIGVPVMATVGNRSQYAYENEFPLGGGNYQPGDIRISNVSTTVQALSDGVFSVGAAQMAGGTATGHYSSIVTGGVHSSRLRLGNIKNRWIEYTVKVDNLPDATNDAIIRIGFSDSTSNGAPSNGAFFNMIRSVDAVNWVMRTVDNNVQTSTSTAVPFTAGTFQRFGIEINDALTAAYFFIDDVLVGTITTTVPASNRQIATQIAMIWIAGSSTRTMTVDRVREHFIVNAANLRVV